MSWEIAAALAASAAASLLYSNYQSNQSNAYNSAEAEKEREWQTYMSNTAYQRSVADMKAAGLNPMLSGINTSSASSGAGASASSATTVNSNAGDIAGAASNVLNAMSNAQNADTQESLAQSQESLNITHEAVNSADESLKQIQALRESNLISYDNARILSEYELQNKMKADAALANAQANTELYRPAHVQAMTNEANARAAQSAMETRERPDLYFSESVRNYSQAGVNSANAGSRFYDRIERYNKTSGKTDEKVGKQRGKHTRNSLNDWGELYKTIRDAADNVW